MFPADLKALGVLPCPLMLQHNTHDRVHSVIIPHTHKAHKDQEAVCRLAVCSKYHYITKQQSKSCLIIAEWLRADKLMHIYSLSHYAAACLGLMLSEA